MTQLNQFLARSPKAHIVLLDSSKNTEEYLSVREALNTMPSKLKKYGIGQGVEHEYLMEESRFAIKINASEKVHLIGWLYDSYDKAQEGLEKLKSLKHDLPEALRCL